MFKQIKNNNLIFILLALILFLPPFFSGGRNILIQEIILILVGLLFFLQLSNKTETKLLENSRSLTPIKLLSLYLILSLVVCFFSTSPYDSFIIWLHNLGYAFLFLCASQIKPKDQHFNYLIKILLAVSGVLCLVGIYFYLTGGYSRLTSTFWWPNPFASFLFFSLPFWVYFFIRDNSKFKLLSSPLLILILTTFVLTGSRGAFLSIFISIFIFSFLYFIANKNRLNIIGFFKKHWLPLSCIIILFTFLIFIINIIKADNIAFIEREKSQQSSLDLSSRIRLDYWQGAWKIFKDYPIFGSGLGSFSKVYPQYQNNSISAGKYAHNWYLEILAEQGIMVFMVFILFLAFIFWDFINRRDEALSHLHIALSIGILAFLIHNTVDIGSHYLANMVLFWFFLGIIVSRNTQHITKTIKYKYILSHLLRILCVILIIKGIVFLYSHYNFQKGLEFQKNSEFKLAQDYYAKSIFLNSNPDYLRQYGIILYSQAVNSQSDEIKKEVLNKALEVSQKSIKLDSRNALNYELRGRVYKELNQLEKSEKDFRKAIEFNKFTLRHYINLSLLLIQEGRQNEAEILINEIFVTYNKEVVENRKLYILKNQKITSGIEKEIEYLKKLKNQLNKN